MGFKDKFGRKKASRMHDLVVAPVLCTPVMRRICRNPKKERQDRQRKHREWKYEGGNGGHCVTFERDLYYHPSATPGQSPTDLQLPGSGDVRGRERERGHEKERRGVGKGSKTSKPTRRRTSPEKSLDEAVAKRRTRDSSAGSNMIPAVTVPVTGTGVTTTTEQACPTSASDEVGWSPYVVGAAIGIGLCAPFAAAGVVAAAGCVCAAAGATAVINNFSNNNRAVQISHDQRVITEAKIQATADIAKHKATIAAQERVMTRMIKKGQYGALGMLANDQGSWRKKSGGGHHEIGGPKSFGCFWMTIGMTRFLFCRHTVGIRSTETGYGEKAVVIIAERSLAE